MPRPLLPLLVLLCALAARAAEYPAQGPDIYDPQASGASLVTAALARAAAEHKHVLLDFGANWCPWCHRLDTTLKSDPAVAAEVAEHFVVVMIDVNMRHGPKRNTDVNARYGNPIHEGLPVLVVLDATGRQLVTQESGILEEGEHHSPHRIVEFLRHWEPARTGV